MPLSCLRTASLSRCRKYSTVAPPAAAPWRNESCASLSSRMWSRRCIRERMVPNPAAHPAGKSATCLVRGVEHSRVGG